jgi:hypothetical protein
MALGYWVTADVIAPFGSPLYLHQTSSMEVRNFHAVEVLFEVEVTFLHLSLS